MRFGVVLEAILIGACMILGLVEAALSAARSLGLID